MTRTVRASLSELLEQLSQRMRGVSASQDILQARLGDAHKIKVVPLGIRVAPDHL